MDFKERVLKRDPDAAYQEIDGMALVIVPGRAEVEVLNAVGTRVWSLIDGDRTVGQILEVLHEEFDVDPASLEEDVRQFVESLDQHDMLLREREEAK